jgi:hypothetical protein
MSSSSASATRPSTCVTHTRTPTVFACLQVKISKALALREQQQRKRNLTKYIPDAAGAIYTVLAAMAGSNPKGPKRRRLQEASNLLHQVARKEVRNKMVWHVRASISTTGIRYQAFIAGGACMSSFVCRYGVAAGVCTRWWWPWIEQPQGATTAGGQQPAAPGGTQGG